MLRNEKQREDHYVEKEAIEEQIDNLMNTLHPGSHDQTISKNRQLLVAVGNAINDRKKRIAQLLPEVAELQAASKAPCSWV